MDIVDIVTMADATKPNTLIRGINPNCDIDGDGDIDIFDIVIDTVNYAIRITPEKHSNPRMLKASVRLIERLTALPNTSRKVFGGTNLRATARNFERSKKLISTKTKNPRLLRITYHTFRHWKATMEYHRTKDILHVMRLLGHKNLKNTMTYTQLVDLNDEDYISKVAWTLDETCKLVEAGFQYVCDHENAKVFRKPK